ncbi:MAG: hypothetical protein JWN65_1980 [Solirubrobacterales bacterium]|nr:hypothetical protein [Solirubrobacterales bacterium]
MVVELYPAQVLTGGLPGGSARPALPADQRAARRALRDQVARLERDLADTLIESFPLVDVDVAVPARGRGPRLLSLGDLERLRDDLADKLRHARVQVARQGEEQAEHRALLEQMLIDPGRHKFVRLSLRDLGETGCGVYEVRPRLGIIGMLAGWWHVKLSSGCPLATLPAPVLDATEAGRA